MDAYVADPDKIVLIMQRTTNKVFSRWSGQLMLVYDLPEEVSHLTPLRVHMHNVTGTKARVRNKLIGQFYSMHPDAVHEMDESVEPINVELDRTVKRW